MNTRSAPSVARRLAVAALASAALVAPVSPAAAGGARTAVPNPSQRVILPASCADTIHHITRGAAYVSYTISSGHVVVDDHGGLRYGGAAGGTFEQPRSFTEVETPGTWTAYLSIRANGELWRHTLTPSGNVGTRLSTRWNGITKIAGTDNGIVYAVTSTGGLNAYRFDGTTMRFHDVIGTKGWTTLKSLSGYARADGNDSLVAVTAAGELVDYIIRPSGATRASYSTQWKVGISQVSVGRCENTPGRPIHVVIGSTLYEYYDRDALNGPHPSLQDISSVGTIGRGWTGLIG